MNLITSPCLRLVLVAALFLAWYIAFPQYLSIGITLMLLAGWATAWDLLGGWTGQSSLGHAAFVGLGAYTIAVMSSNFGTPSLGALLIAMCLSAGLACICGRISFGIRGAYFTLSTIPNAQIIRMSAVNGPHITNRAIVIFILRLD